MGEKIYLLGLNRRWIIFLIVLSCVFVDINAEHSNSRQIRRRIKYYKRHAIKSIKSEDGDTIDCIDMYKQPAFDHPALRNHKIQMTPSYVLAAEMEAKPKEPSRKEELDMLLTSQLWQRNASCPAGTIPLRRIRLKDVLSCNSIGECGRKALNFDYKLKNFIDDQNSYSGLGNHSSALLVTEGYNYHGAKADIKVWSPYVQYDDEHSTSRIALLNGPNDNYESIESGWAVNPSVYGDRHTRLYTYWTADSSKTTGCFDLFCPGFVQTSNEIALGGVIKPIPVPGGLPWIITLQISKDPLTNNWWLHYQEKVIVGYWPAELFGRLSSTAETVNWGGEVYSSRLGHPGHTSTQMGSGDLPSFVAQTSGWTKRMRICDSSMVLKYPDWAYTYMQDWKCYSAKLNYEFVNDPEFYFGGPGYGWERYLCD